MTHTKTILLSLFFTFILIAPLAAKAKSSSKLVAEAKKYFKEYANLEELQNRGFDLSMFDSVETMEDIYNILLPYMFLDGAPLDNTLQFRDYDAQKDYNYKRHHTVHFTDDYGTKEELINKGYKEDEIFAYYSKGKDIYRGGKYVWEKIDAVKGGLSLPGLKPVIGPDYVYFFNGGSNQSEWKDYCTKPYLIIDRFSMNLNFLWSFFNYLRQSKYEGQVILICDSGLEAETIMKDTSVMEKINYITIGTNTLGKANYGSVIQIEKNRRHWTIPKGKRNDFQLKEGVGFIPDVWAENTEDILKAIEVVTGINLSTESMNLYKDWRNIFSLLDEQGISCQTPLFIREMKNEEEGFEAYSKFVEVYNRWYQFCRDNKIELTYDKLIEMNLKLPWWSYTNKNFKLTADEYMEKLNSVIDDAINKTKELIEEQ